MFLHPWLGFTLWNVAAFFTHSSISNQPKKQKQKKKKKKESTKKFNGNDIYRNLSKKKKKYIIYGKMFHSFFPFFVVSLLFCPHGYLFWPAVTVTRWDGEWSIYFAAVRGDEEHQSRRRRRRHRHCAGLSFGSSVALGVMWLLPSWLKMNQ